MESNNKVSLLEEISKPATLKKAWASLNKSNKLSRGFNSETIEEFQSSLEKNIDEISNQLKKGTYKFSPVRGVLLQKKEKNKYRPLRIQDVRDRLVCKAIVNCIDPILTPIFNLDNEASFAYRKNKGIDSAIRKMVDYYKSGYKIIFEADIIKFFDNVDSDILLCKVYKALPDNSINELIKAGLSQEVGNLSEFTIDAHHFEDSLNGIPQGNALSPLFANVYLATFDENILNKGYKLIRYADDFIVMCKDYKSAEEAYLFSKKFLEEELKLKIHELDKENKIDSKTKISSPNHQQFKFLSICFNGSELWVDRKKVIQLKEKISEVTNVDKYPDLITVLTKTRNLVEGWLASFKFVDVDRDLKEIDDCLNINLNNVLRKFGFHLKSKHLQTINYGNENKEALTYEQRRRTGVKPCPVFLKSIDRKIVHVLEVKSEINGKVKQDIEVS